MPDQATYTVPVKVNVDRVPDEMEMFSLTLSTPDDDGVAFNRSSADVIISDTSEQHIVYVVSMYIYIYIYIYIIYMFLMRDEKEERKKQARSNKHTRQSNSTPKAVMLGIAIAHV